ncbi:MAG: cytochrome P450 [Mycobacterium sp.]
MGVGDRLLDRQGRALGPRAVKVLLAQGITQRRYRGFVCGVPGLKPDFAAAFPNAVCRAEKPRGFVVSTAFTPRSTARLQTTIVKVITELVDPVTTTGCCDVVADIARRYPIPIICGLLGARRRDWQLFSHWAEDIFKIFTWNVANDAPVIMHAFDELDAYIDDMVAQRRRHLTDDLISELIRAEDDGDRLTADELTMLAEVLLMAATDSTRNQLAAAVQDLCDHPQQWALLAEHPELAPQAVEELMRHSPVIFTTMRKAAEDVQLAGVTIPAGTFVLANTASANRDPAVYDDPDRLDITREGPATRLSFGGGIHYCLGAHLARAELTEALTVITRRMPNPHRSGPAPWKPLLGITGPTTLPIEFDPGH